MLIGEANINTDYIDITEFPVTLCHEISHAKGYARENDAQTLAILSCIHSPRADFRYAGFIYVFNELYAITYQYAKAYDYDMPSFIDYDLLVDVDRDLVASEMYDQSLADNIYTRLVEKFSRKANDVFLKANGQEDGVESYNVPSSIFLEFYFKHVKAETDA